MAKLSKGKNKAQHKAHVAKSSGKNKSAFKSGNASSNPHRKAGKGQTHMRTKATINRLNMYRQKAPNPADMKKTPKVPMARIHPDRRWFGNVRTMAQDQLQKFRAEMSTSVDDPYSVVLKASKLPMTLLKDNDKQTRAKLLQVESYEQTFGAKKVRKKPNLAGIDSLEAMMAKTQEKEDAYDEAKDHQLAEKMEAEALDLGITTEAVMKKGTSRRIWAELYKVIDSSDVVIEVIDARDPMGTRCLEFERELRKKHPHKKLVLLMNKVDLIPSWVAARWTAALNKEYPTVAFHASISNPFGKSALIQLLRQFGQLLKQRMHVAIGLVGYPNVGKSSVINALKMKKVCKAAPVPGQTKVWQYVHMTKKLHLIDCPGITPPSAHDFAADSAKVLKGVVRIEKVETPSHYVPEVLERVKHKYLVDRYAFPSDQPEWEDYEEFLTDLAKKMGKLRKGGEPDCETVAKIVLYDWQRGRLPFFTPPPAQEAEEEEELPAFAVAPDAPDAPDADGDITGDEGEDEAEGLDGSDGSEDEEEETVEAEPQGFEELQCALQFDADDLKGAAVVAPKKSKNKKVRAAEAAAAKAAEAAEGQKGKAKKAKASKDGGAKKAAKGKAEKAKGKKKAGKEGAQKAIKKGAKDPKKPAAEPVPDWAAIANEFAA